MKGAWIAWFATSAAAIGNSATDSHYDAMYKSFFSLTAGHQLGIVNRTIGNMRAARLQFLQKAQDAVLSHSEDWIHAADKADKAILAGVQSLHNKSMALKSKLTGVEDVFPVEGKYFGAQRCSWTCGWAMYRDLNMLVRYAFGYNCEFINWVDWWSNGIAALMVDSGEPLHRALLELAAMYTTVGYGLPYTPRSGSYVSKIWHSLHAVTGSLFILRQVDRVIDDIFNQLARSIVPEGEQEAATIDHMNKIIAATFLGVEMVAAAFFLRGDTELDSSRHWYADGWYMAAMTAASVGYGDFAPYSSLGGYFSPIWMSILVSTWNSMTATPVYRNENDCSFPDKLINNYLKHGRTV